MKIYLAGPIETQKHMVDLRSWLEDHGYSVTSRWLDIDVVGYDIRPPDKNKAYYREWSGKDLEDVAEADCIIHIAPVKSFGASVEFGYALALGRKVFSFGPFHGIFQLHPEVTWVELPANGIFDSVRARIVEHVF